MARLYWLVLCEIPNITQSKVEATMFWIFVVMLPLVGLLWPGVAPLIENDRVVRGVSLLVLGGGLFYATLKANHNVYEAMHRRALEAESVVRSDQLRAAQQAALGNWRNRYIEIMNSCTLQTDGLATLQRRLVELDQWVYGFVEQHFNRGEASLLNAAAIPEPDLNALALIRSDAGQFAQIYMTAQHKAITLARLIEASRFT